MNKIYDSMLMDIKYLINNTEASLRLLKQLVESYSNVIFKIDNITDINKLYDVFKEFKIKAGNFYCIVSNEKIIFYNYSNYIFNLQKLCTGDLIKEVLSISKGSMLIEFNEDFINDNVCFLPIMQSTVCDKKKYVAELAKFCKNSSDKKYIREKKLLKLFNKVHNFKINSFDDIFENETGAVKISNEDLVILLDGALNCPIADLFELSCIENKRKYSCNEDDYVLLRGPLNYYFNLCCIEKYSIDEIVKNTLELKMFLEKSINILKDNVIDIKKDINSLKMVLAILDIIKNFNSIYIYYYIRNISKDNNLIYVYNYSKNNLNKAYEFLKETYGLIYDALFLDGKIEKERIINAVSKSIDFQSGFIKDIKACNDDDINFKSFRLWRETDNIIENIVTIEYTIEQIIKEKKLNISNKLIIFGLNYGSLELAILAEVLFKRSGFINCNCGEIIINLLYSELYNTDIYAIFESENNLKVENEVECIIIDDNIVSGKSIQAGINLLSEFLKVPKYTIVVRKPSIKRVNQMYNPNNNCRVNINLFSKYIKGLLYDTFFTKLNDVDDNKTYCDKLGVFDQARDKTEKNLFKNSIYLTNSWVGKRFSKKEG